MTDQKKTIRDSAFVARSMKFHTSNFKHILELPEIIAASTISSYISYGTEPDTAEINQAILQQGKSLVLPRVNGDQIDLIQWNGDPKLLKTTKNLVEPTGKAISDLQLVDVVITPALIVDMGGFRLGKGGGFYDRIFPNLSAFKIGLVYEHEFIDQYLPRENHDIPLDAVATPSKVVRFNC